MSTGPQSLRLTLLNTFFPTRCIACKAYGSFLCMSCAHKYSQPELLTVAHNASNHIIQSLVTAGNYHAPELGQAMEQYKFHAMQELASLFADLLWNACTATQPSWLTTHSAVYIVPIPLHRKRIRERGFDQNLLLANAFVNRAHTQGVTHIHTATHLVTRHTYTQHQTSVNVSERDAHLHGAFSAVTAKDAFDKNQKSTLVLLDDIVTTGATMNQVAQTLAAAGHANIHAAAILRAK